jgi:DNA phosphorothioation-associated putative methyltransferase
MVFQEFKHLVRQIETGKQLPDAVYLHRSALEHLPAPLFNLLAHTLEHMNLRETPWTVVKFFKRVFKLSLLDYPDVFTIPFPILRTSCTINLEDSTCRKTQYARSKNPPILHRKEILLLPSHPDRPKFNLLTEQAEAHGLFENTRTIGFKKNWERLLKEKRLRLVGHSLVPATAPTGRSKIDRHKTAIDRNSLSTPVQSLFRNNFLNGSHTFFDYGCGKGDDINILKQHKVDAAGWDPVFFPDEKVHSADIINLGFVLNIIESPEERQKTLKKAFRLADKLLVVSVMLGSESLIRQFKPYGDGVITSRNTFQKYYTQAQFREYLEITLKESAIAAGPGLFYIFKDELEEQQFLVDRQRRKKHWQKLSYTDSPERMKIKQQVLYTRHQPLLDDFWNQCLYFGRLPLNSEYHQTEELKFICGSLPKAFVLLTAVHGSSSFKQSEDQRRNDLLVHFALGLFRQRKPYKFMPKSLQKDIKHFFGKYTDAVEEAKALLFSIGYPNTIKLECEKGHKIFPKGRLDQGHSWTLHMDDLNLLSPTLRIYVGCTTHLYGDLHGVDLFKFHMQSN